MRFFFWLFFLRATRFERETRSISYRKLWLPKINTEENSIQFSWQCSFVYQIRLLLFFCCSFFFDDYIITVFIIFQLFSLDALHKAHSSHTHKIYILYIEAEQTMERKEKNYMKWVELDLRQYLATVSSNVKNTSELRCKPAFKLSQKHATQWNWFKCIFEPIDFIFIWFVSFSIWYIYLSWAWGWQLEIITRAFASHSFTVYIRFGHYFLDCFKNIKNAPLRELKL